MSDRVYIIYSAHDRSMVEAIRDALVAAGLEAWFDPGASAAASGREVPADMRDAIDNSGCVVVLSPQAADDPGVWTQVEYAVQQGRPVMVAALGDAENLPFPGGLTPAEVVAFDAANFDAGIQRLVAAIRRAVSAPDLRRRRERRDEETREIPALPGTEPELPPATAPFGTPSAGFVGPEQMEAEPPPPSASPEPVPHAKRPHPTGEYAPPQVTTDDMLPPTAARGRRSHAEEPRPARESASPHFSAFYPERVQPGQPYALMAFVHLDSALERVREVAAGYAGMMGGQPASGTTPSAVRVDPGSLITFVPQVAGLRFDPTEQAVTWQPPYQSATFLFTAPAALDADLAGRVLVYQGPLILGEIPVRMARRAAAVPGSRALTAEAGLQRFDPVFASYSHRDAPVMQYFRRARERLGQRMLVDIYDLRAGEHWADRLLEMIDQSAVFQLFWSQHSAQSAYCRQEWQHALGYLERRPRFIQPVWWQVPMPPPPPELADLHFQRVALPPVTRAQLALDGLRRKFRRG